METVNDSGTFTELSCPRLLVHLHRTRFDGTLRVTQQGLVKLLYFQHGEIAMASSNDSRDHLAPILIRDGKLKSEQLDLARKSAKPGTSLARVLVQMGFLTSGELFAGARQQLRQIVGSLLPLTEAQYALEKDHFPREVTSLNVDTREMLLDLVRKISERTFILSEVGSPDTRWERVPAFSQALAALRLPTDWKELAERFASSRTTHEFGQASGLDDFEASKVIYGLQLMGLLQRVVRDPEEDPVPLPDPEPARRPHAEEPVAAPEEIVMSRAEQRGERIEIQAASTRAALAAGAEGRVVAPPVLSEARGEAMVLGGEGRAAESRPKEVDPPGSLLPPFGEGTASPDVEVRAVPAAAPRGVRLGSLLSILTGLTLLAGVFYWFVFLRGSAPEGGSVPTPAAAQVEAAPTPDSAPPKTEPRPERIPEPPASSSPGAGSEAPPTGESAPKGGNPQPIPQPSPDAPAAVQPPAQPPPTPAVPAPAPSLADAGRFNEARNRLDQGEYGGAASAWLAAVQKEPSKRFTLQLAIACQEESLRTAAVRTRGSASFFVVPFELGGKSCFRLCWGAYATVEEAQSYKNSVPAFFLSERGKPVVVSFGKLLPTGDR